MPDPDPETPLLESEEETEEDEEGTEEEEPEEEPEPPPLPPTPEPPAPPIYPPSPLQRQRRDHRSQSHPAPIEVFILSGEAAGKIYSFEEKGSWLGVGYDNLNISQSVNTNTRNEKGIVSGTDTSAIGPPEISFDVEFYDLSEDVQHLSENLRWLLRQSNAGAQPQCHLRVGAATYDPVQCTRLDIKPSLPFPGRKGFMRALVSLSFVLLAGAGSKNAFVSPAAATPIGDTIQSQTVTEREEEAALAVTQLALHDCLGEEGKAQLESALAEGGNALANPDRVAEFSSDLRVQLAVAGAIPSGVLADDRVREEISYDVAYAIAQRTPGVTFQDRELAEALVSGNATGLDPTLQPDFDATLATYTNIRDRILEGNLSFEGAEEPEAQKTLQSAFGCGLLVRQSGAPGIGVSTGEESRVLDELSTFLSSASVADVRDRFGLESDSRAEHILNGHPYASKQAFIDHLSNSGDGISAHGAWGWFAKSAIEEI